MLGTALDAENKMVSETKPNLVLEELRDQGLANTLLKGQTVNSETLWDMRYLWHPSDFATGVGK